MIEFIEEQHIYLVDGIITPSVSEILRFIFPDKYKSIPQHILDNAARFGTNVHTAIEMFETDKDYTLTDEERAVFDKYLVLREKHNINPTKLEQLVSYKDKYVGRLDMIADVNYYRCLIDIKTTYKLDEEALAWQLGLYKLAYNEPIEKCYCLWLPKKNPGKLVEITPKGKKEIDKILDEYEKDQKE